jgi:hypothetical protein
MSDDRNAEVDPRFDPAFQRGFDPTIPIQEYVPEPSPRRVVIPPAAAQPVVSRADPVPAAPDPAPAGLLSEWDGARADASGADPEPSAESTPSRNPFLLLLGLIAVALVVAGVWLFIQSGEAFNSTLVRSQGDYMSLDASIHAAPFIALLGGATAIGVVFVFASKWRARR